MPRPVAPGTTIAFLGPEGTFTEEALRSEADLAGGTLLAQTTFAHVLAAVSDGTADFGFVAIENSIEGTVNVTLDQLVFERDLLIVREVVTPISENLLGVPGARVRDVKRVVSFPVATAQCRAWLARHLPDATEVAATSTAEAVRQVALAGEADAAAIGPALAAERHGLKVLAAGIEDHDHNVTRFVLVARPEAGIPPPSGHDKTSVVCFQSADRPGSLRRILGQFAARDINLVKLESRPTKRGLGDYCFIIDFEGHVADEVVADCLRDLHTTLRRLKFLGSYPAAGPAGRSRRADASAAWRDADQWITELRASVRADEE
jgi:prephenate dehydratase